MKPTLALAFAGLLVAALPALAADPPPRAGAKVSGFGSKGGPLLTRAELRACLQRSDRIRAESEAASRERSAIEAEQAALVQGGEALKAELAALDRTSVEAVEKHVAKAKAHDARIDAHTAAVEGFNTRVAALQKEREAFSAGCDNRRYDEADENAIRAGR